MPLTLVHRIIIIRTAIIRTLMVTDMAKIQERVRGFHLGPMKLTNHLHRGAFMRCFITGGAGFIGSHLSEALLAQGEEVFVLDDLSTGSVENILHLKTNNRFHYI